MARLFFSLFLLIQFPLIHADPNPVSTTPPAMITITPPDLPKSISLEDELKRDAKPATPTGKHSYFLSDPNEAAYLEFKQDDTSPSLQAPRWELFRWESSTDNNSDNR
ncbi:MAG: hypothetical protein ISR71_05175 [Gammaproteobacteria bacterium]|nr:hypothetical protein [Gammaproteobacteria bacterium]